MSAPASALAFHAATRFRRKIRSLFTLSTCRRTWPIKEELIGRKAMRNSGAQTSKPEGLGSRDDSAARLRVRLLGAAEVILDGRRLKAFNSSRLQRFLALLALRGNLRTVRGWRFNFGLSRASDRRARTSENYFTNFDRRYRLLKNLLSLKPGLSSGARRVRVRSMS